MSQHSYHIILLFLLPLSLLSQPPDIQFEHITMKDGLSNNNVYCILQDSKGFMWFGTSSGLNRYDGYNFITYEHESENTNSVLSSFHAENENPMNFYDYYMATKTISKEILIHYFR